MTSKKNPQKPAEQKPESDAVETAIETKAAEAEDDKSQDDENVEQKPDAEDSAHADAAAEEPALNEQSLATVILPEVIATVSADSFTVKVDIEFAGDLANRLTKAASAATNSGNPELAQSLNRLDLLVGDLKNALPAAIKATEGEQLSADLTGLLAKL